jgi:polar amino acid transport system substrate-binding protein
MLSLKTLFLLILVASQSALAEETIKIGFAYFPPYSEVENGKCKGHYCELAKKIFTDNLGIEIEAIQHPWARIQREVEPGNIDVMFVLPSKERQIYAIFSETPAYKSAMKIFTYQGHDRLDEIRRIKTLADVKDLNLVSITNQGNGWHAENVEILGINTVKAINDEHTLKMLAAQRGDIAIDVAPSMR